MSGASSELRAVEPEALGPKEGDARPVVLTPRDRELFVHLSIARYLSLAQIGRLIFPGKTDSIASRRLRRLSSGKHQYVRRLPFRTKAGDADLAWCLRPLGFLAARNLYGGTPEPPRHEPPTSEFLEHDVRLNELYVALATAAMRRKLSFGRWPFRWLPSDSARLPWTEFDRNASAAMSRLICPDATLELLEVRRRIFIELETGTHTLGFQREGAAGRNATKTKIERYARFMATPASAAAIATFYTKTFPDAWPAELLFVVPSGARRDAIASFVAGASRPLNEAVRFSIRALTQEEAPLELCRAAQLSAEAAPSLPSSREELLTPADVRAIYDFYNGAIAAIAAVRHFAKSHPELSAGLVMPDYPVNHQVVKQLCVRLGGGTR